jgi:hypothetical protein
VEVVVWWLHVQAGQSYVGVSSMLVGCGHQTFIIHFIILRRSRQHVNLLLSLSCNLNNFNNFLT